MSVRIRLSNRIYPRECLAEAIRSYAHLCSVGVCETTSSGCQIEITAEVNEHNSEAQLVRQFLNYLLELSLERHLALPERGS